MQGSMVAGVAAGKLPAAVAPLTTLSKTPEHTARVCCCQGSGKTAAPHRGALIACPQAKCQCTCAFNRLY
eukprot:354921-Chlamydomonas_euryale.AAC.5